eukprot:9547494-Karenia_brevis.AAC.1
MEYFWDIDDRSMKALDNRNEDSILDYISTCEALVRTKALGMARSNDKTPWGVALKAALKEESNIWQDN